MSEQWRRIFRGVVAGEWLLNLTMIGASVPPEIQDSANQTFARDPRPFHLFLGVACGLGLLKIAAEIGLFLFRAWARPLFAALALATVATPFLVEVLPPEIAGLPVPAVDQSLALLLSMADGAIIALAYGSPVGVLFGRSALRSGP